MLTTHKDLPTTFYVLHPFLSVLETVDVIHPDAAADVVAASEVVFVVLVPVVFAFADVVVLPVLTDNLTVSVVSIPVVDVVAWVDNPEHPIFSDFANIGSCPTFSSLTAGENMEFSDNSNCGHASYDWSKKFSNMGLH
jgi:hypothetical protein